jgi:hypothetical protein
MTVAQGFTVPLVRLEEFLYYVAVSKASLRSGSGASTYERDTNTAMNVEQEGSKEVEPAADNADQGVSTGNSSTEEIKDPATEETMDALAELFGRSTLDPHKPTKS